MESQATTGAPDLYPLTADTNSDTKITNIFRFEKLINEKTEFFENFLKKKLFLDALLHSRRRKSD